jgi:hypothetical protein
LRRLVLAIIFSLLCFSGRCGFLPHCLPHDYHSPIWW